MATLIFLFRQHTVVNFLRTSCCPYICDNCSLDTFWRSIILLQQLNSLQNSPEVAKTAKGLRNGERQEFTRHGGTFGGWDTLDGRDEKKVRVADGRAENHGDFSWARLKTEPAPGQAVVAPSVDEWGWFCERGWNFLRARSCHVAHRLKE